jgi:putative peptidoglycan lipid II flippase
VTTTNVSSTDELAAPDGAVGDSMSVALWTVISRITGVLRGVVVAAVLGATYFANTYQFTNSLPNLVFYGLLGGSLFSSLLVPALVRHLDTDGQASAARLAGGLFGCVAAGVALLMPVAVGLGPVLLNAAGGPTGGDQARVGSLLVLMVMPQVALYAVVGTATAVMNAQRRFALAAAAPALENVGIIAVLGVVAVRYSDAAAGKGDVPTGLLLLLGLGTTTAVFLHATVQWLGARRAGVVLVPRAGWRDPEVRALVRSGGVAAGQAALVAGELLVLLVLANRVAGGVVALQLALNFFYLPIAIGATPVALSLSPRLARMRGPRDGEAFRDTFVRGVGYGLFVTIPAAAAYAVLAEPISRAISYGGFADGQGVLLLSFTLAGLALGVVGETVFMITTYACYSLQDTRTPLRAVLVQVSVGALGATGSLAFDGPMAMLILGLAWSLGSLLGASVLLRALLGRLTSGQERLLASVARTVCASLGMIGPAYLTALAGTRWLGGVVGGSVITVGLAAVIGVGTYVLLHRLLGSAELGWALGALGKGGRDSAGPGEPSAPRRRPVHLRPAILTRLLADLGMLGACGVAGVAVSYQPLLVVLALVAAALGVVVYRRPAVAAYLIIGCTPLVGGIDRGTILPAVRPNEALLALLVVVLGFRWLVQLRTGEIRLPRASSINLSLVALGLTSSVVPLIMMIARNREITGDDLSHVIVLWKLVAVYAIVAVSVHTRRQAYRCVMVSLGSAAVVCVVGVLQSLHLFGVEAVLAHYYSPFGIESALAIGRGSSTLSLPAAVADLAILNFGFVIGLLLKSDVSRRLLIPLALIFVFGVGAAAEFSTVIGLGIAFVTIVIATGAKRLLGYAMPVLVLAFFALRPVIEGRLSGFSSASGLPVSWIGRLRNLQTYFWPEVMAHWNWVLGVRPSARVPAASQEFGWIWIESGYIWLLWGGGMPLLLSYLAFVLVVGQRSRKLMRMDSGPTAATALGILGYVAANAVLMLFDPHLTYRGAGDALFATLALLRVFGSDLQSHPSGIRLLPRPSSAQAIERRAKRLELR